jgi:hypothetical protein
MQGLPGAAAVYLSRVRARSLAPQYGGNRSRDTVGGYTHSAPPGPEALQDAEVGPREVE